MFILTARVNRKRLAAGAAALVLLCGTALAVGSLSAEHSVGTAATAAAPKKVKTNEDRIAYLESYGWQVNPEPIAVEELLIPEEFDETYAEYLALQESQGFDLTEYCGKRVKRCTYEIINYPTGEAGVQVSLLIYKNQVVGGEVLSAQLNGFLHGLERPA
ncbi:MAG: DUF4830 domain-containing protein [Oscillospiraceae bacterium]